MQKVTLGLAAMVLAGFVSSDAMAQRSHAGSGLSHGGHITNVAHHGRSAHGSFHSGRHGSYHGSRYGSYYRPGYGHGYHGYSRYRGHHGYHPPVIVTPRPCVHPPVHGVYRPNYHPLNTFYYGGRNFGIGISF